MAITSTVGEQEYRELALNDPDGLWELRDGRLVGKPVMSFGHAFLQTELIFQLRSQLAPPAYHVRANGPRLRRTAANYYLPDVAVIPRAVAQPLMDNPELLDAYAEPLPFVVEIWSPSTGGYDQREKLAAYQARGDLEIWLIHPFERTVTVWRRQADGAYAHSTLRGGVVAVGSLPGVTIDLDALFDA